MLLSSYLCSTYIRVYRPLSPFLKWNLKHWIYIYIYIYIYSLLLPSFGRHSLIKPSYKPRFLLLIHRINVRRDQSTATHSSWCWEWWRRRRWRWGRSKRGEAVVWMWRHFLLETYHKETLFLHLLQRPQRACFGAEQRTIWSTLFDSVKSNST